MQHKKGKEVVRDLKNCSKDGIALAKQTMLSEKMNSVELHGALRHYLHYWRDYAHAGFFAMAHEAVGGNPDNNLLSPQEAIVMLAAALDIHDDIIDKSAEKNKIPTVYGKYGIEIALLLGNAFLIQGLKILADSVIKFHSETSKNVLETTRKLLFEVGNAHALEVGSKQKRQITPKNYLMITNMKAASIEADLMLGAFFGGGNEKEVESLARIGRILGVLAILREDLVDVFDIEELRQRIIAKDLPLPLLFAMKNKKEKIRIEEIISRQRMTEKVVNQLVEITLVSAPVKQLKKQMRSLIDEGISLLNELPRKNKEIKLQTAISFMLEDL